LSDPRVAIVVLNYRNYRDTVECVRSLERMDYPDLEVVIVDNDSPNESERVLRETFPLHTLIQSGANRGYAAGNNVGLRRAVDGGAELVAILNNDTLVDPDFASRMVAHAAAHPEAGALGALIVREDGSPDAVSARRVPPLAEIFWNRGPGRWFGLHQGLRARAYYPALTDLKGPTEVEVLSGSCLMLRASLLREIGFLDEATFLFWEEFILAEKIRSTSFRTFLFPDVRVLHKGGRSVRSVGTVATRAYLKSLDHYLERYRGVGFVRRYLTMAGPALFLLPGTLRTALGLRAKQA